MRLHAVLGECVHLALVQLELHQAFTESLWACPFEPSLLVEADSSLVGGVTQERDPATNRESFERSQQLWKQQLKLRRQQQRQQQ